MYCSNEIGPTLKGSGIILSLERVKEIERIETLGLTLATTSNRGLPYQNVLKLWYLITATDSEVTVLRGSNSV